MKTTFPWQDTPAVNIESLKLICYFSHSKDKVSNLWIPAIEVIHDNCSDEGFAKSSGQAHQSVVIKAGLDYVEPEILHFKKHQATSIGLTGNPYVTCCLDKPTSFLHSYQT